MDGYEIIAAFFEMDDALAFASRKNGGANKPHRVIEAPAEFGKTFSWAVACPRELVGTEPTRPIPAFLLRQAG